jgi:hypothetical protein
LVAELEMVELAEVDLLADLVVVLLAMADYQGLVRRRLHLMQQLQQVSILLETQVEPHFRMVRVEVALVQTEAQMQQQELQILVVAVAEFLLQAVHNIHLVLAVQELLFYLYQQIATQAQLQVHQL